MKVAIVVPYFTPFVRGNEFGLAAGLSRHGVDVTILASNGKAPREKMVIKDSPVHQDLPFTVKYLPTPLDIGEIPFTPTIFTEVLNGGYDALLLQEDYQPICHIAYAAARLRNIPTILSTERTYFPSGNKKLVLDMLDATVNRWVRNGATVYTAHCSAARDFIQKELYVPEGRVKVIHVGVDTELFKPTRGKTPLLEGEFKILTVARLHPYKGLEHIIKAMAIVKKQCPGAILYIMGRGPSKESLKRIVNSMGLTEVIRFVDTPVPNYEMPQVYTSADIYVQPSIIEPYGIAVLEAMACGKPVIGTRVGGMMDTIKDGVTGFLVPPADHEGLAKKIVYLASEQHVRENMGNAACKRAKDVFDWSVLSLKYIDLIREGVSIDDR